MAVYAQGRNAVLTRQFTFVNGLALAECLIAVRCGRVSHRARENADRFDGSHDAALRSVSGPLLADTGKSGMTEQEFDAAVDMIASVDAGVLQSLNQRIKQRTTQ